MIFPEETSQNTIQRVKVIIKTRLDLQKAQADSCMNEERHLIDESEEEYLIRRRAMADRRKARGGIDNKNTNLRRKLAFETEEGLPP